MAVDERTTKGKTVTFKVSMILWAAVMLTWSFWWSRRERRRKAKAKFMQGLKGFKFESIEQLKLHWRRCGVQINLDGPFDEFRHGDLQDTLMQIDADIERHFKSWQRR